MGKLVLVIGVLALYIYALVDLLRAPREQVRLLPRWLWAIVIILIWILGPLLWLAFGRPRVENPPPGGGGGGGSGGGGRGPRPRGPIAPDDDPEFLKRLDEQSWAARMERMRRERQGGGPGPDDGDAGGGPGLSPGDPTEGRHAVADVDVRCTI